MVGLNEIVITTKQKQKQKEDLKVHPWIKLGLRGFANLPLHNSANTFQQLKKDVTLRLLSKVKA